MPLVTDNNLIVIAILMAMGGGVIATILLMTRSQRLHNWALGAAATLCALVIFGFLDDRDARLARADTQRQAIAAAGYLQPEHARITLDLNRSCPPRTDGLTDQLVMTISTQADHGPVLTGCSRIAHR